MAQKIEDTKLRKPYLKKIYILGENLLSQNQYFLALAKKMAENVLKSTNITFS